MPTFIHTADLHLDTPFSGLSKWDEKRAATLKSANKNSFNNIINICISEKIDFLVVAGDVFDAAEKSLSAQLSFAKGLEMLATNGIRAYVSAGNHDPLTSWSPHIKLPENTVLFDSKKVEKHIYIDANGKPSAEILGISHDTQGVKENLMKLFPGSDSNIPVIAVLHGNLSGQSEHEPYAPFQAEDMHISGIDYWALGHIHKRQVIRSQYPAAVYPGNPQGRHFGETGEKGCYKVRITNGQPPELTFLPLATTEFIYKDIDISGIKDFNSLTGKLSEFLASLPEEKTFVLRLTLSGRTALHSGLMQSVNLRDITEQLSESGVTGSRIYIDRLTANTSPHENLPEREKAGDFTGEVLKVFRKFEENPELIDQLEETFRQEIKSTLPGKRFPIALTNEEKIAVLNKARWMFYDHFHNQH